MKDFEDTSEDKKTPGFNTFPFGKDLTGESCDFMLEWSVRLFNHELLNKLEDLKLMTFKLKAEDILFTAVTPLETSAPSQQANSQWSQWEKVSNSPSKYVSQSPSILSQAPSVNSVLIPTFHPSVNSPSVSPVNQRVRVPKRRARVQSL